eukprot:28318-Alexandrium_andersonii.AAC.1
MAREKKQKLLGGQWRAAGAGLWSKLSELKQRQEHRARETSVAFFAGKMFAEDDTRGEGGDRGQEGQ